MIIFKNIFLNKKEIILKIKEIANNSNNSISLKIGGTYILGILIYKKNNNIQDFLPLNIIYKEKASSLNKIPYGYIKKDIKFTNREIILMRVIDRLIRPLIKINIKNIQIILLLLSYDKKFPSDSLLSIISSIMLYTSKLINKLFYQIRIIKIKHKYIINPKIKILSNKNVKINLLIGGNDKYLTVMEGEMKEISYKEFINIIKYSFFIIKKGIFLQKKILKKYYKYNKNIINKNIINKNIINKKYNYIKKKIYIYKKCFKNIFLCNKKKDFYYKNIEHLKNKILKIENIKNNIIFNYYFNNIKNKIFNKLIIYKKKRLDNRNFSDIRSIFIKNSFLSIPQGSCLFSRGNTQVLVSITLSTINNANIIDILDNEYKEKLYVCYNFYNFSVNEIIKNLITSRREIGHGYLIQKSFKYLFVEKKKYIVRVIADVLKSDGSTSMASVCATNIALLDAGVYLKRNVSGISYGILKYKNKKNIITDISEIEDYYGNMDFKITGTNKGFTSCQIDVKNLILNLNLIKKILKKAKKDLLIIKNKMNNIISVSKKLYIHKLYVYKKYIYFFNKYNINNIINKYNLYQLVINYYNKKGYLYLISKKKKNIKKFIYLYNDKFLFFKKKNIYKFKIKFINIKGIYISIYNIYYFLNKRFLYYKYNNLYYFLKKNDYINLMFLKIKNKKIIFTRNFI
ncbi:MAG: hypothetical protein ABNO50_00220 [Candidatus Shikimatogenerans sp. Tduv]|uniref:Exoribonuclease phosphorolytic domain-containing protein n=1 Tax=Candidatus Shikimatogenerans sp. Tduv TaxID=3158567 RepID=A0AAU7QRD3_9FLAO